MGNAEEAAELFRRLVGAFEALKLQVSAAGARQTAQGLVKDMEF